MVHCSVRKLVKMPWESQKMLVITFSAEGVGFASFQPVSGLFWIIYSSHTPKSLSVLSMNSAMSPIRITAGLTFSLVRNLKIMAVQQPKEPLVNSMWWQKVQWYVITVIGISYLTTGEVTLFYMGISVLKKKSPVYIWTMHVNTLTS
jgi:hypothetical protein